MMPIEFEGCNTTLHKPLGMSDEQCLPARAFRGVDNDGYPFVMTAWQPSKEDIDAINAGRPICLKVLGPNTPPVALYTVDENFEPNV